MNIARYSLLTLRPVASRIDTLCVGVAILRESDEWAISTLKSIEKIAAVDLSFGSLALSKISKNLETFFSEYSTLEEVRDFLRQSNSSVQVHDFEGGFSFNSEDDFQRQVREIMMESVLPVNANSQSLVISNTKTRQTPRAKLRKQFINMGIMGKTQDDINDHKVVSNYPISQEHGIKAEYAIKNGVWRFTETIDFGGMGDLHTSKIYEAQAKCLALKTAKELYGSNVINSIVISSANHDHRTDQSISLLSTAGSIYDINNSEDMTSYFNEIGAAGLLG